MFQADICLLNFDNEDTLEQYVKYGHKTNMNGVNGFLDTNKKFLSDIKKIHSTSVDPDKCLPLYLIHQYNAAQQILTC